MEIDKPPLIAELKIAHKRGGEDENEVQSGRHESQFHAIVKKQAKTDD